MQYTQSVENEDVRQTHFRGPCLPLQCYSIAPLLQQHACRFIPFEWGCGVRKAWSGAVWHT